jgi:hypothetical protein
VECELPTNFKIKIEQIKIVGNEKREPNIK